MNGSEPMTEHGLFWLRDNEQKKLWGTLYISETNEVELETFGSLIDPMEGGSMTILGQIRSGQEWVTLIDCFPTNTQNPWASQIGKIDWSHQTCLINIVVQGMCFEEREEIAFERATLSITSLSAWAKPKIVKLDHPTKKDKPRRIHISIEDRADEKVGASFRGEEVEIALRFLPKQEIRRRDAVTRILVEDHCNLTIARTDGHKMPLSTIFSVGKGMQDILSICCNETPIVNSCLVQHGNSKSRPAKVFVRMRGSDAERKNGRAFPALDLEDIGGMRGVARWFELSERYGEAIAYLTSTWYNDKSYPEDKLSRMYVAIESLVARKKNRKTAKMTEVELAKFIEEGIPNFLGVTNMPPKKWAARTKSIRNQKISHLDPSSTAKFGGRTIDIMANVLYVAGASFLLREMGMDNDLIEKYVVACQQTLLLNENQ